MSKPVKTYGHQAHSPEERQKVRDLFDFIGEGFLDEVFKKPELLIDGNAIMANVILEMVRRGTEYHTAQEAQKAFTEIYAEILPILRAQHPERSAVAR